MLIHFRSKYGDFDTKLTHPKMQDKRKFGKTLLLFRQKEKGSKEELKLFKETLQEVKSLNIDKESKFSLENIKKLI